MTRDAAIALVREQVIRDTLREHPWSTARMLSDVILEETGGAPALLTGALWIAPWTVYATLRRLLESGAVERRTITARTVLWRVAEAHRVAPPLEVHSVTERASS